MATKETKRTMETTKKIILIRRRMTKKDLQADKDQPPLKRAREADRGRERRRVRTIAAPELEPLKRAAPEAEPLKRAGLELVPPKAVAPELVHRQSLNRKRKKNRKDLRPQDPSLPPPMIKLDLKLLRDKK